MRNASNIIEYFHDPSLCLTSSTSFLGTLLNGVRTTSTLVIHSTILKCTRNQLWLLQWDIEYLVNHWWRNHPHMPRHHASKRVGFSPNPCFEPKEFKRPNTSFKFSFHEVKKRVHHAFDKHKHFAKNPCLQTCSLFMVKW